MEIDTTSIDERVARGVALLDEKESGWREKVDADRLDMGTCNNCIFGQVYGNIAIGLRKMGLVDGDLKFIAYDEDDPGFQHGILTLNMGNYDPAGDFSLLTDAWKRALGQEG